ncbi:MAG: flagellar biosynthesis protein FliQ [Silvanigrellales bacterium]|nr:flagellar biosynthesis protein FliQ [Silvanigrellales bacterium]
MDLGLGVVYATAELSLPLLATALAVGLIVSVFQAATQLNEATLSFLPKIAAMIVVLILVSPWMLRRLTSYTSDLYKKIPEIARQR